MKSLIGIHGFEASSVKDKSVSVVLKDRVNAAIRFLDTFEPEESVVYVNIDSEKHTHITELLDTLQSRTEVKFVDETLGNTEGEIKFFVEKANQHDSDVLVTTSSIDHTPRIERLLNQYTVSEPFESIVFSGEDYYTENEVDPFIMEGRFEEFIDPLGNLFSVDESDREQVAERIRNVFN